jgi:type I thyroxine 5'-deiodinase
VIYIQEAHPTDLWQLPSNVKDGVLFASPRTTEERNSTATACVRRLGIRIPALLDSVENRVEQAYAGWPDRLYLIAAGGMVAFKSEAGPFGFAPEKLEGALKRLLGET